MLINNIRQSFKSLLFAQAKYSNKISLDDIPTDWKETPSKKSLWKKIIDEAEMSVKAVYYKNIDAEEDIIHYHDYTEHIIVLKGEVIVETDKTQTTLTTGDSYTILANIPHYTIVSEGTIRLVLWYPVLGKDLITNINAKHLEGALEAEEPALKK